MSVLTVEIHYEDPGECVKRIVKEELHRLEARSPQELFERIIEIVNPTKVAFNPDPEKETK